MVRYAEEALAASPMFLRASSHPSGTVSAASVCCTQNKSPPKPNLHALTTSIHTVAVDGRLLS